VLKRMELYADAALLGFPCVLAVFALLVVIGPIRGSLQAAVFSLPGGLLAIPIARLLHRSTTGKPLPRGDMGRVSLVALGAAAVAGLLGAAAFSASLPVVWVTVSICVLAVAAAMVADAFYDLTRVREHKVLDVVRLLLIGLLGVSWLGSGTEAAVGADVGPWVVGVTAYMLVIATAAAGLDLFLGWRAHHVGNPRGRVALSP